MKKTALLIAAAILLSVVFTSCTGDSTAPQGMKLLSTEANDFEFYIPEDWIIDAQAAMISAICSSTDRSNISITSFSASAEHSTIDQFWAEYSTMFAETFSDIEYETEGENTLIDKTAAKKYVYTATVLGVKYKYMQAVVLSGGYFYLITFTTTVENYDMHAETVELMLNNFKFKSAVIS